MTKRRRRKTSASPPPAKRDPRDDLPDAPAMRSGLYTRPVEATRYGDRCAVRAMPWQGIGLSRRQEAAAERYADMCATQRKSPAPRSCIDIACGGYDDSDPTEADARMEAEFTALNRVVHRVGMAPSAELSRVCWCLDPPRDVRALAVALDAVADFCGISA